MISPRDAYATLVRASGRGTVLTAVRRPLVVALVLGVSTAMSATGHVTPSLLLSTTACWSFLVVIQAAIALTLIAGRARRTVGLARAIDLYFAGHAPWSLWMLAAAAWAPSPIGRPVMPVVIAAAVPLILTPRILSAYFREVLEMEPRDAVARAAVQQAMTWVTFVVLFGTAVALTPRVLQWFA
jgi:hypothetical protein